MKPPPWKPVRFSVCVAILVLQLAGCVARPTWHGDEGTAFDILNQSTIALLRIDRNDPGALFKAALHSACAVFVFPGTATGVPMSAAARSDGVLLVRDRASGHWNGPAFYAWRSDASGATARVDRHARVIAVGCDTWQRLYAKAAAQGSEAANAVMAFDAAAQADTTALSLSSTPPAPASLDAIALRPLPAIALAYYQAPAPLGAVMVDRSVRNDASAEILTTIAALAR